MLHNLAVLFAALLIALNVADWRTTRAALTSGIGRELNPVMAWLMARMGIDTVLIVKVLLVSVMAWLLAFHTPPLRGLSTLVALAAFYVWIVVNNLRVLRQ